MTVIVGWACHGRVVMGGDSAALSGWEVERIAVPKLFRLGPLLLGVAGSPRVADVLRYQKELAESMFSGHIGNPHRTLVLDFIPWLRSLADDFGLTMQENGETVLVGQSNVMVALAGKLFVIGAGFSVNSFLEGYTAIGVGAPYALGALYTDPSNDMRVAIQRALEAAEKFCTGVAAPFTILESEDA